MGNIFWKIFFSFWLTLILIAVAVSVGTAIFIHHSDDFLRKDLRSRYINTRVELLTQVIYYGGEDAATDVLQNSRLISPRTRIFVVDEDNEDILGREFDIDDPELNVHDTVESIDGDFYQLFSKHRPKARGTFKEMLRPFKRSPSIYLLWLGIAVLLSTLVCLALARYLSQPIRKLQIAAKKLSQGALDTRVTEAIGNRRDEIADLGQEFDQMASRLQRLVNNQKQLLSDISHELRSPLARIQLALGLARKKLGDDVPAEIQRIEQEAERLDDLVGQSLTLSRLDAGAEYAKDDLIDIATLLENIISDCDFEASEQNKQVLLDVQENITLNANGELLHRALENVIRNAIRYTQENTRVEVALKAVTATDVKITIADRGKGVAEDKLNALFEPFVRLEAARDRDSGGYGLGLAIAKRAIEFHQGEISANNNANGGLTITIVLPKGKQ